MQTGFSFLLYCVLQLLGFIASAPVGPAGQSSVAALISPLNSTRSSFPTLLRSNDSINSDPAICPVANTRTVLIIRFFDHHPIDPGPTLFTINAAINYIERAIHAHGDGRLPASNDPFRYDIHEGIVVAATSAPNVHMTWGVLGNAMKGLLNCVAVNEWYDEAHFEIFDGDSGHVGDGALANAKPRMIAFKESQ